MKHGKEKKHNLILPITLLCSMVFLTFSEIITLGKYAKEIHVGIIELKVESTVNPEVYLLPGEEFNEYVNESVWGIEFWDQTATVIFGTCQQYPDFQKKFNAKEGNPVGIFSDTNQRSYDIQLFYKGGNIFGGGRTAYVLSWDKTIYANPQSNGMFLNCDHRLTSLDLSGLDTSNVTNMQNMFQGCQKLTSLDLSSFDTSNVTNMQSMFYGCSSLSNLNLSSFNTSNVTNMQSMFHGCSSLTDLNLNSFNTSNVTNMQSMFHGCQKLNSLDLSSFDTSCVTNMRNLFDSCQLISVIYVSNLWRLNSLSKENGRNMFKDCINLKGGKGTSYNKRYVDASYAHIDSNEDPGYFTEKEIPQV